jgi:REP element-mobilizing transposase RayT
MARPLRIEYPGAFYHITARGNERKDIFKSARDREQFLSYLESAAERYGAAVHAYCLMSNHYHLLLETPRGNLSQIMRHINGAYTTYFNAKRRRAGHLLQGRYKAILVEADEYAKELSRYIHLNPVRAGAVDRPGDFPWSSYADYVGARKPPEWLAMALILDCFGKKVAAAQRRYREFVEGRPMRGGDSPLNNVVASTILGSEDFVETIRERYLKGRKSERDLPAVRRLVTQASPGEIAQAVEAAFGDDAALARQASLYVCHTCTGRSLREIGSVFGISESGVSQASRRMGDKLLRDAGLRRRIDAVREAFSLSNV